MTRRGRFVIGNWKMYPETIVAARKIFDGVRRVARNRRVRVVICPPTLYLSDLMARYKGTKLGFGAQDVSLKDSGSYTGEISPTMLDRLGVRYVILGHSERRALGESNSEVAQKVKTAIKAGLTTILCIGELQRDHEGAYLRILEAQLKASLKGVVKPAISELIVAYEPVWAIGKSARSAMKPGDVHETLLFIKKILTKLYGRKFGLSASIVYGGSVEPANVDGLCMEAGADGFLIGHKSLAPKDFAEIVSAVDRR